VSSPNESDPINTSELMWSIHERIVRLQASDFCGN
jgi:hypothetical protein